MLVLSRKIGERLVINDNIVVEVVAVQGNRIRLGILAPADVSVWREELAPVAQWAGEPARDMVACTGGARCLPKKG